MKFVTAKELAYSSELSVETLRRWGSAGDIVMRDLSPRRARRRTLRFAVDGDGMPVKRRRASRRRRRDVDVAVTRSRRRA